MRPALTILAAMAVLALGVRAQAQTAAAPFTGPYAGLEAGALEHHFYLQVRDGATLSEGYHRAWGLGGGGFVGGDLAVSPRLRLGFEGALTAGGASNTARFGATALTLKPRYGYRLVLRGGVLLDDHTLLYADGGYGGNGYRVRNTAGVANVHAWGDSFVVGAGVERRLSNAVSIRLDFKHVDNQSHQLFLSLPVRF